MAILSCHVSIKLPPKISDGQGLFIRDPGAKHANRRWIRVRSRRYVRRPCDQEAASIRYSSDKNLWKAISATRGGMQEPSLEFPVACYVPPPAGGGILL